MTLEEKEKFIEESKKKNYLFVSPRIIRGGAKLVHSYETLELYQNMAENTKKFAEKEIVNLISSANSSDKETNKYLKFSLVFCGDFDDLPNNIGSIIDFIMNNKDKIIAVYRYVKSAEQREFFEGFAQSETIYNYGYLYLSLARLLEEFEENNVKCEVDNVVDRFGPVMHSDDASTNFVISYSPKKVPLDEKGIQFKKTKNN